MSRQARRAPAARAGCGSARPRARGSGRRGRAGSPAARGRAPADVGVERVADHHAVGRRRAGALERGREDRRARLQAPVRRARTGRSGPAARSTARNGLSSRWVFETRPTTRPAPGELLDHRPHVVVEREVRGVVPGLGRRRARHPRPASPVPPIPATTQLGEALVLLAVVVERVLAPETGGQRGQRDCS